MSEASDHFARRVMSGEARGVGPSLLRGGLSLAEPVYAGVALLRNRLFDTGIKRVTRLPRPVISVGNLTAGGTGKTPMVRWLANHLRANGHRVAILSRGYKSTADSLGDELTMLDRALNSPGLTSPVLLRANPDRSAAGAALLAEHPEVDVILLDDGFQHRRVARDLDVVLINATEPFGFDHVLPRGLLREPVRGLKRAGAVVLTRCDRADEASLADIERHVRRQNAKVPLLRSVHAQTGFRAAGTPLHAPVDEPMASLAGRNWFVFSGIGSPDGLRAQLATHGGRCAGSRAFGDHHEYSAEDLAKLMSVAKAAGADVLVTTEKDWVKVEPLWGTLAGTTLPVWRVDVEIALLGDGASALDGLVARILGDRQR
jgi:tetraacyldisaccharide 4'-kinase